MRIIEARNFRNARKRLHANQKQALDEAIRVILDHPTIGDAKTGDLADVRVYKFRMVNQLVLLAYIHNAAGDALSLVNLGTHENFYRDLKAN